MTPASGLRNYRRLFAAYATGLLGTGVAIVGLALLAFDLAEDDAGLVIATALSIKVFSALTGRVPKKPLLVGLDLLRAGAILTLPFAAEVWHLYLAVFVFTAASAAFTPTYQALTRISCPTRTTTPAGWQSRGWRTRSRTGSAR